MTATDHHRDLVALAINVIESSTADAWRHHGFGLLSLYVTPAHRINMWSEDLRQIQPHEGAWHTRGSTIHSTVLAGSVCNSRIVRSHRGTMLDAWVVHDGDLIPSDRYPVIANVREPASFGPRSGYLTQRGCGHCTEPGVRGAVTSVLIMGVGEKPAEIWVPTGTEPKRAFDNRCSDEVINRVRANSLVLLREQSDAG